MNLTGIGDDSVVTGGVLGVLGFVWYGTRVPRIITHRYRDPFDELWLAVAAKIGFSIRRSGEVYAHSDGKGVLHLAEPNCFDADDSLAQLVLHELCHAMVEGPRAWTQPDWGLDNVSARDEVREHAALRLQAKLTSPHGLRWVLAPTTDFRSYFDALPEDALSGQDPAIEPARAGFERSRRAPFHPSLEEALRVTAQITQLVRPFAAADCVFARFDG